MLSRQVTINTIVLAQAVEIRTSQPLPAAAYPLLAWLADWWQQQLALTTTRGSS